MVKPCNSISITEGGKVVKADVKKFIDGLNLNDDQKGIVEQDQILFVSVYKAAIKGLDNTEIGRIDIESIFQRLEQVNKLIADPSKIDDENKSLLEGVFKSGAEVGKGKKKTIKVEKVLTEPAQQAQPEQNMAVENEAKAKAAAERAARVATQQKAAEERAKKVAAEQKAKAEAEAKAKAAAEKEAEKEAETRAKAAAEQKEALRKAAAERAARIAAQRKAAEEREADDGSYDDDDALTAEEKKARDAAAALRRSPPKKVVDDAAARTTETAEQARAVAEAQRQQLEEARRLQAEKHRKQQEAKAKEEAAKKVEEEAKAKADAAKKKNADENKGKGGAAGAKPKDKTDYIAKLIEKLNKENTKHKYTKDDFKAYVAGNGDDTTEKALNESAKILLDGNAENRVVAYVMRKKNEANKAEQPNKGKIDEAALQKALDDLAQQQQLKGGGAEEAPAQGGAVDAEKPGDRDYLNELLGKFDLEKRVFLPIAGDNGDHDEEFLQGKAAIVLENEAILEKMQDEITGFDRAEKSKKLVLALANVQVQRAPAGGVVKKPRQETDAEMAARLQREENARNAGGGVINEPRQETDAEMAARLQQEEYARNAAGGGAAAPAQGAAEPDDDGLEDQIAERNRQARIGKAAAAEFVNGDKKNQDPVPPADGGGQPNKPADGLDDGEKPDQDPDFDPNQAPNAGDNDDKNHNRNRFFASIKTRFNDMNAKQKAGVAGVAFVAVAAVATAIVAAIKPSIIGRAFTAMVEGVKSLFR